MTYVHVHAHRQACCDVLLPHCALSLFRIRFPLLHRCQCFPEYPALHFLLADCAGCVALTLALLAPAVPLHVVVSQRAGCAGS